MIYSLFSTLLAFFPDQEVPESEIVSFEVKKGSNNTQIVITLSKDAKEPRFYLEDGSKSTLVSSIGSNPYTLTITPELEAGKEYKLVATDVNKTFEQTKTFTYRALNTPISANIAQTSSNKAGEVNATNVTNATIVVSLVSNNKPINNTPGTLEVTVKDTATQGQVAKKLVFSQELVGNETEARIENVDLSSLNDGNLTLEALIRDDQGNVSGTYTNASVVKKSNLPIIRYTTVSRNSTEQAQISIVKTSTNDVLYYLVKEAEEAVPTVDEVIKNNKKDTTNSANVTLNVPIDNGDAEKAYVVYLAATSVTGTKSADVVAVNIAKVNADPINEVNNLVKKTGTEATFVWNYDEATEGFVGYKVALYNGNTFVTEQIIGKGEEREINFFDEMKKAAGNYTVKVTAVANNVNHTNSVEVVSSTVGVTALATPASLSFDTNTKTLLKWTMANDIQYVNNYTIEMAKYNATSKQYEVLETASTTSTSYDVQSMIQKYGIGEYQFKITANAKADVLRVNATTSTGVKYILAEGVKDLAVSKVEENRITLDGTLLPNIYSTTPTYTLYSKTGSGTYSKVSSSTPSIVSGTITELPQVVGNLTAGTEYLFKLVTKINDIEYVSNEVSVITKMTPISTNELTYKAYTATSAAEPMANLTGSNEITYNEENETVYIKNGSVDTVAYSSENEAIADIVSVLKQMTVDSDKIQINKNEITKLDLTSSTTKITTYDLSKISENAIVTIKGNADRQTIVRGTVKTINLTSDSSVKAKFDLTGLTVTNNVSVKDDEYELSIGNNTVLSFASGKTKATINKVSLEQTTKLGNITIKGDTFDIAGGNNKLTIDTTKSDKDVTLNFTSAQTGLDIKASETHTVKVIGTNLTISTLSIKSGKVDLTDNTTKFSGIKAGNADAATKVILVTDKAATDNKQDAKVPTAATALITGSAFKFNVTNDGDATYSTTKGSNEITLNITAAKEVAITK